MLMDSKIPDHLRRNATIISEAFAEYGAEVDTISIATGVTVALYNVMIVSAMGVVPIANLQEKITGALGVDYAGVIKLSDDEYLVEVPDRTSPIDPSKRISKSVPLELDPMFDEAVLLASETDDFSVVTLQRKLGMGYARACKVISQLEASGVLTKNRLRQ